MTKYQLMASFLYVACLLACVKTATVVQRMPPGSSYTDCGETEEYCLRSLQEGAGLRCLPIGECGLSTIEETGKCERSVQCNHSLECCTTGPKQAAEHLRCYPSDACAPGSIAP